MKQNITIIGAGLVGSLLSIYLSRKNYNVSIFERRPDMRRENISAGRSINLALSERGWKAIAGVGIEEEIRNIGIPMFGRMLHDVDGKLNFLPYGKKNQAIYSVSRGGLNCKLMDLAEKSSGVKIHFNEKCNSVNLEKGSIETENTIHGKKSEISAGLIIGADGAYSAARLQMQLSTDRFEYSQHFIPHGYKELTIPANAAGEWVMEKNALHIWPRGKFMLIALPNLDGSFTCTLFFPFDGENSFSALKTKEQVLEFFEKTFPDAVPLMPSLLEDYFRNPASSLVTVKSHPWNVEDKMFLIGDAAHAIVPFFGQGMNAGFEDCTVLDQLIEKHGANWKNILTEFVNSRKPDTDAIAELAIANFIEMRDLVARPEFVLRKKIENRFSRMHPEKWIPLYSMVTFSPEIRYSEALASGRKQDRIMDEVMEIPGIEEKWDSVEVEELILKRLS